MHFPYPEPILARSDEYRYEYRWRSLPPVSGAARCHAGAMNKEAAIAWGVLVVFALSVLAMPVMLAAIVVGTLMESLRYRSTTTAVALASDGLEADAYHYRYVVADRVCRGQTPSSGELRPPPETTVPVHYDPNNICDGVTHNPVGKLIVLLSPWLVGALLVFWPRRRPNDARPVGPPTLQ
jgi:hypothetical protein